MKTRIHEPLPADHPLVARGTFTCWKCKRPFREGERTVALPIEPNAARHLGTVETVPMHATCALRGVKVRNRMGEELLIESVDNGRRSALFVRCAGWAGADSSWKPEDLEEVTE